MKEVAKAHEKRSLGDFENVLKTWKEGAFSPSIPSHRPRLCYFAALADTLIHLSLVLLFQSYRTTPSSEAISPRCTTPSSRKTWYESSSPTRVWRLPTSPSRSDSPSSR
jgi:hypothetical protein